ncbi:hypothetical protein E2C01_003150 [Portunus trituberculatus]|uniref:Uncharacterized protein n=1 Tax=Portunus trituberculatus TaxID=210409 RepID=A0A5B7CSR6_PORTR|nr:hypothetical protein [Portunus trituberculatus]
MESGLRRKSMWDTLPMDLQCLSLPCMSDEALHGSYRRSRTVLLCPLCPRPNVTTHVLRCHFRPPPCRSYRRLRLCGSPFGGWSHKNVVVLFLLPPPRLDIPATHHDKQARASGPGHSQSCFGIYTRTGILRWIYLHRRGETNNRSAAGGSFFAARVTSGVSWRGACGDPAASWCGATSAVGATPCSVSHAVPGAVCGGLGRGTLKDLLIVHK